MVLGRQGTTAHASPLPSRQQALRQPPARPFAGRHHGRWLCAHRRGAHSGPGLARPHPHHRPSAATDDERERQSLCREHVFPNGGPFAAPYANYRDAVAQMSKLIARWNVSPDEYQIVDGSGLSLYNYLTPELLVLSLRYAYRNGEIISTSMPRSPSWDATEPCAHAIATPLRKTMCAPNRIGRGRKFPLRLRVGGQRAPTLFFDHQSRGAQHGRGTQVPRPRLPRTDRRIVHAAHSSRRNLRTAPSSVNQPAGEENGPDDGDGD